MPGAAGASTAAGALILLLATFSQVTWSSSALPGVVHVDSLLGDGAAAVLGLVGASKASRKGQRRDLIAGAAIACAGGVGVLWALLILAGLG